MDCVLLWIEDSADEIEAIPERMKLKLIRDTSNIMNLNEKK